MTYELALNGINMLLEKFRTAGDIKAFNAAKVVKTAILKHLGEEVAKEYIELFGEK